MHAVAYELFDWNMIKGLAECHFLPLSQSNGEFNVCIGGERSEVAKAINLLKKMSNVRYYFFFSFLKKKNWKLFFHDTWEYEKKIVKCNTLA